jgi:hypothetical protein
MKYNVDAVAGRAMLLCTAEVVFILLTALDVAVD